MSCQQTSERVYIRVSTKIKIMAAIATSVNMSGYCYQGNQGFLVCQIEVFTHP